MGPCEHVKVLELGRNTAAETKNGDKNSLCICYLVKDLDVLLNEKLNMNQ